MTAVMPNLTADSLTPEDYQPTSHHDAIETVISSMAQGDSAMVQHSKQGAASWKFTYGSVSVFVQMTGEGDDDIFTVWADVMPLPQQDCSALLMEVMGLNWSDTLEARFALRDDHLVTLCQRTVADLSPGEISRAITLVATIADDHDDRLKAQYGV